MTTGLYKKGIVLAVIVLFIGAGVVSNNLNYAKAYDNNNMDLENNIISYLSNFADEFYVFNDPQGDVLILYLSDLDGNLNFTDEKPNIDIKKITYNHDDGAIYVSIVLEVYGEIEDKGNLSDVDSFNSIVLYSLQLETSDDVYDFSYVNGTCQINSRNTSDWSVNNGVLTINFNLDGPYETFKEIYCSTMDTDIESLSSGSWSFDTYPDIELISIEIHGGFRVSAVITNTGFQTLTDVPWSIDLDGGLILAGEHAEGVISELAPGATKTIRQSTLCGIGNTVITVTAGDATKTATGFVLGPLVLGVEEI